MSNIIGEKVGEVTYERALETLREVVAGREDYVYPYSNGETNYDCKYFEDVIEVAHGGFYEDFEYPDHPDRGAPSCIVGHVLHRWGVTLNDVEGMNSDGVHGIGLLFADAKAEQLLMRAQTLQDLGDTWGDALYEAIIAAEEVPA